MAFVHLAGVTTAGAADEVIDWFSTFEAWMVSLGWTVEAGGGTQDITFRSSSEAGGLTMLYLRAWRDLVNVDRVYFRVQDDLAGTHFTTPVAGGYVDSGGVQFAYWMSGDKDAIIVCFKLAGGYRHVYAGMVIPFALTVPDETYRMIVATDTIAGTILRNHDGTWDVDSTLKGNGYMWKNRINPYDSSFSLCGTYFSNGANIAGQLKHISLWWQNAAGLNAEDTIDTGRPGATTTWIVLKDNQGTPAPFALRTGGVLPVGIPDATFAAMNGPVANRPGIYTALAGLLGGLGWADLGDPGVGDHGRLFYSQGESGEENIYVLFSTFGDEFHVWVQDDAIATHRTAPDCHAYIQAVDFPANIWISADKDCVVLVVQRPAGYTLWWGGMVAPFSGALVAPYSAASLTEYSAVAAYQGHGPFPILGKVLRGHDGTWTESAMPYSEGANMTNSNPNAFDGTTYLVWPFVGWWFWAAGGGYVVPLGQMKYYLDSSGGGIANLDTITVGAKVYTVFFDSAGAGGRFALRTT